MSDQLIKADAIESALILGDLSKLSVGERVTYYNNVCNSLGLNPMTKPFAYITLNGKLTLYALKDCTEQLRSIKGISIESCEGKVVEGVYIVTAMGRDKSGRADSATGAVPIEGLKGEAKANALMKAETKAKRRLTLSLAGLGMLDESEAEVVPGAVIHAEVVSEAPKALPEGPKKAPESHSEASQTPPGSPDTPSPAPEPQKSEAVPFPSPEPSGPMVGTAESLREHLAAQPTLAAVKVTYSAWKLLNPTPAERSKGISVFAAIRGGFTQE